MKFYNIKDKSEQVSFSEAVNLGLGSKQGLFFPVDLPKFTSSEINDLLELDFVHRSLYIMSMYINDDFVRNKTFKCISNAFTFPVPLCLIKNNIAILELFHGPTFSFKDFGCRFMAQVLSEINDGKLITILTATSGDTGAAVAHAFYGIKNIQVVILYPYGKITSLQERLFCVLGHNIYTLAVDGNFDLCQLLVKQAFDDQILRYKLGLNSANSINISRLLVQICYYFEIFAQLPKDCHNKVVISVPSGNFGNLTAGLLAQSLGLPVSRFIIATNINDTVPRFLHSGDWCPKPTVSTLSNAMDISCPNNWVRIEELFHRKKWEFSMLSYGSVNDIVTVRTMREILDDCGYISEPHAAVSYRLLSDQLERNEFGVFLGTAHPAKFQHEVENIFERNLSLLLPSSLLNYSKLPVLSRKISANFSDLRDFMLSLVT